MSIFSIQHRAIIRLAGPAGALLLASMFLGVIYNAASPLGVRSTPSASAAAPLRETASLQNETISVSLLSPSTPPRSGRVYQNETISLSFKSPQTAGTVKPARSSPTAAGPLDAPVHRVIPSVTWHEVRSLLAANQVVLVDARVAAQYQAGHIPGALSLTAHGSFNELSTFAQKYPRTTTLVIYCGTEKCPMAHDLAETLIGQYGFVNVRVMPGGYAEYRLAEARTPAAPAVK